MPAPVVNARKSACTWPMKLLNSVVKNVTLPLVMLLPSEVTLAAAIGEMAEWLWEPLPRRSTVWRMMSAELTGATSPLTAPPPATVASAAGARGLPSGYTLAVYPDTPPGKPGATVAAHWTGREFAMACAQAWSTVVFTGGTVALKVEMCAVGRPG